MFLSAMKMCINIVCALLLTGHHDWSVSSVAVPKCNPVSITLPKSSLDASLVMSFTFSDVSK